MKITFNLSEKEAFQLSAELYRVATRVRSEALYRFAKGSVDTAALLTDKANLYLRLRTAILKKAL